jgi:hypothetical protein
VAATSILFIRWEVAFPGSVHVRKTTVLSGFSVACWTVRLTEAVNYSMVEHFLATAFPVLATDNTDNTDSRDNREFVVGATSTQFTCWEIAFPGSVRFGKPTVLSVFSVAL